MLSFSYTITLQLRDTLNQISRLREQILTLPLSPKTEAKLSWEGLAIRTWATLSLAGYDVPKHEVATILAHSVKPTPAVASIMGLRHAHDFIHAQWRANPRPVSTGAIQTLFELVYPRRKQTFGRIETSCRELLEFIATEEAHPLIQAAIAHMSIAAIPELDDPHILAHLTHYLFLAKYGYDVRGYITPQRTWQSDRETYERLIVSFTHTKNPSLTVWLDYMANTMRINLETILLDIQESRFHIEFPARFWELSDRQKEILKLLDAPDASVTNRQVHKQFRVSQITASRDLTKLTTLGLLYPHGKGRSVYYTKI